MKELIYTDEKYISETKTEIQKAHKTQQKLLDTWNSLNIGECPDLFQLAHDPYNTYRKAAKIPAVNGSYKIGEHFLEITDIPLPNQIYIAARDSKKCIMTGHRDLWSIENGETVVLNQDLADIMIHSRDVWIENEKQKEFVTHCINYVTGGEYLFQKLQTMISMKGPFNIPFTMKAKGFSFINSLELEPEALREMIKQL